MRKPPDKDAAPTEVGAGDRIDKDGSIGAEGSAQFELIAAPAIGDDVCVWCGRETGEIRTWCPFSGCDDHRPDRPCPWECEVCAEGLVSGWLRLETDPMGAVA
jgi:hypothetical protein